MKPAEHSYKRKIQPKRFIIILLFGIFTIGLLYSFVNIIWCKLDTNKARNEATSLNQTAGTIDFEQLENINPETQGWLQVKGTEINYAFVKHNDNEFYLTRSFDRTYNRAGWIFMDYRNDIGNLSQNTIIYGHGFFEDIMFGTLKNVLKKEWYADSNNRIITVQTSQNTTSWLVFSAYRARNTSDYIRTSFPNDEDYRAFIDLIKNRSLINSDAQPTVDDKILTLSTCYNRSERLVLHAKLVQTTPGNR